MNETMWFDLDEDDCGGGVLEIGEFDLHLVIDGRDRAIAFWRTASGAWLRAVDVGDA
jgi:hypothetical protein